MKKRKIERKQYLPKRLFCASLCFRSNSGQAMIETLVILTGFMLPIFFGIYYINTYVQMRDTAIEAARYAAWETTVAKTNIGAEIGPRFFRNKMAGFDGNLGDERQGWGTNRVVKKVFHDGATLSRPDDDELILYDRISLANSQTPLNSPSVNSVDGESFELLGIGTYRSRVQLDLNAGVVEEMQVSVPLGRTVALDAHGQYSVANRPTITVSSAIVSNAWNANNDQELSQTIGEMVPFDNENIGVLGSAALGVSESMMVGVNAGFSPFQELRLGGAGPGNKNMAGDSPSLALPDFYTY